MKEKHMDHVLPDNGGRRRIKDRRFRVPQTLESEHRTGLKRRSGWDRRGRQDGPFDGTNRRMG